MNTKLIVEYLLTHNGNVATTARVFGISPHKVAKVLVKKDRDPKPRKPKPRFRKALVAKQKKARP